MTLLFFIGSFCIFPYVIEFKKCAAEPAHFSFEKKKIFFRK